ncbi:hypothetical protein PENTCL1PPCAC_12331, partial [Pristionchus entomophagus]
IPLYKLVAHNYPSSKIYDLSIDEFLRIAKNVKFDNLEIKIDFRDVDQFKIVSLLNLVTSGYLVVNNKWDEHNDIDSNVYVSKSDRIE